MTTSYIICTTPRSGSTLLCKLLASTSKAGDPHSFYHRAEYMREWAAKWGLPDPETVSRRDFDVAYLAAAVAAGKGGTPIFGMRLQQGYLQFLSETLCILRNRNSTNRFRKSDANLKKIISQFNKS